MKIEIFGIPKENKQSDIESLVHKILELCESYKYIWEESKGK